MLFVLLALIATVNVFVVTFAWERFAAAESNAHPGHQQAYQGAISNPGGLKVSDKLFSPRKQVSAMHWIQSSLRCRWDDCTAVAREDPSGWSPKDVAICASGIVDLRTNKAQSASPVANTSACLTQSPVNVSEDSICKRDLSIAKFVIQVDVGEFKGTQVGVLLDEIAVLLRKEESFPVGLGVDVTVVTEADNTNGDYDVRVTSHSSTTLGRVHVEDELPSSFSRLFTGSSLNQCSVSRRIVSIHQNARVHMNALYGSVRYAIVEQVQKVRAEAPVTLAVLIVWAGSKPPPLQLYDVAKAFAQSDTRITAMLMVEEESSESFRDTYNTAIPESLRKRIKVVSQFDEVSKGNLTHFIHSRADVLVPSIKDHFQYALGWSLCDFRWLFGAIFDQFLPEENFTHWAWGDSDAFPGRVLGSFSDYGHDLLRHDVTTFAATIIDRDAPASSMMGYSSGTFTAVKNTKRGRDFFRFTPPSKLDRALTRPSNGILDEVGTSNAVLGAPNVTVCIIGSQVRLGGTVMDETTGRLFFVTSDEKDSATMKRLAQLGRVEDAMAVAPFEYATVLARFQGGKPLDGQVPYVRDRSRDPKWFVPPKLNSDNFLNLVAAGAGFSTILRDSQGRWWQRPLPPQIFYQSADRSSGWLAEDRPMVRVEVAIVHSRLNGPCHVKGHVEDFDFVRARKSGSPRPIMIDSLSKQCSPFKKFFKK